MTLFTGRDEELQLLKQFLKKKSASFIVVRGRRRIGKSRLIEEFAKDLVSYSFAGLAPYDQTTKESQLNEFSQQLALQTHSPVVNFNDWTTAFYYLGQHVRTGRCVIVFDEISWMGSEDHDFLGKLKNAWDLIFKKNDKLILFVCGSASSWIEENILSTTGFHGRISLALTLKELPLKNCNEFWGKYQQHISAYEKLKLLSVTGGVPKYLEEIDPTQSAEENSRRLSVYL
jgi:AAA+ ATPase superfamily predicted ATPase